MVSVVGVRVVLVGVLDGRVPMPMPGSRRHGRAVLVLVVFVVRMPVGMLQRLVPVYVLVAPGRTPVVMSEILSVSELRAALAML